LSFKIISKLRVYSLCKNAVISRAAHFCKNNDHRDWQLASQNRRRGERVEVQPRTDVDDKQQCPGDFKPSSNAKYVTEEKEVPDNYRQYPPKGTLKFFERDRDECNSNNDDRISREKPEAPGSQYVH
jgi:hypothetical protein